MKDDYDLLRRWRQGDDDAGDELIRSHYPGVFNFFKSKLPQHADDLAQRTFLSCVESREQLVRTRTFRAYLFGIARNRLVDHLRSEKSSPMPDLGVSSIADIAGASPSFVAAARDERRVLVAALSRIPVDSQIALELFYWEEMGVDEIAAVLDVPSGTVKSRLSRAREQLRRAVGEVECADDVRTTTLARIDAWEESE